jgi:zinc protease
MGTDAKKEFSDAVVEEVYKEMNKLNKEKVGHDELEKVKNYMKGSFLGSISNVFDLADKFKNLHYYDLPIDYYDHYFENLDAVTPEKIMEIALNYFSERDNHLVIVE